jgi:hypothetical protein
VPAGTSGVSNQEFISISIASLDISTHRATAGERVILQQRDRTNEEL